MRHRAPIHRLGACTVLLLLGLAGLAAPAWADQRPREASHDATPADELPPPRSLKVFGATIRYYELGQGPTVVLVHGLGSSARGDWGRVMKPLAATHRVLALDQLGFGGSDKPFIDYTIQTWVDFLGEFLRAKQVGDFALVGESLGGWVAAQYTIQALKGEHAGGDSFVLPKPSRLVLCDAAGFRALFEKKPGGASAMPSGATLAGQQALLSSIFHDPSYASDEALRRGFAWSLAKGDSWTIRSVMSNPALLDEAVDGKLGAIRIPTLVIWGEHDQLIAPSFGRAYRSSIPGAQWATLPDSGHAPMIETPAAFLKVLQPFLAEP